MSELYTKLKSDIVTAMKSKEADVITALRGLDAAVKNKVIELGEKIPTDEHVLSTVSNLVKRGTDAAEQFMKGAREDLAKTELFQVDLFKKYLPPQMSLEEIKALVEATAEEVGAKVQADFGKVMGVLSAKTKGIADGKVVSQLLREFLNK
jgi:uncharacterized protein YqeY